VAAFGIYAGVSTGAILAIAPVHTSGINWQEIGVISGIVGILVTLIIWLFNRKDKKRDKENDQLRRDQKQLTEDMRRDITDAVNHLSEVLLAKLETKDTVAAISVRLARLEGAAGAANNLEKS
jgi:membrane protein implicated in regulation of membrane protease activity